ncbi:ferrous iron transport protein A [Anaerotignum lactatifermentans]|uniref:Ferrous iron transport protein A n=1 Tax=Anaerotignum lactatifermentans TaxID=160404 RepID=A0ABS2GAZ9_9FIRM|nr:FeoA family protein [Anaerotignum lactatifermentans]MBM6830102.1 ferrous iron transport protein A [Anaerotignum lactatifermentans]MBM6878666.1 ferrous iron transport protein A [Anaerotignum lactatifermentans]MBM6951731.1 ferrous iron transport protein A [Anaerotignum lactatifermentans]
MAEEITLAQVPLGQLCRVEDGAQLRLMELGFCGGSLIRPLYGCFGGGTRVYCVKGTMIALRDRDASQIIIRVVE